MKFCKNCEIQLEDENSKFCPNCGIDLRQKLQQNNDERSMLNSIPSIEERTPKYKKSFTVDSDEGNTSNTIHPPKKYDLKKVILFFSILVCVSTLAVKMAYLYTWNVFWVIKVYCSSLLAFVFLIFETMPVWGTALVISFVYFWFVKKQEKAFIAYIIIMGIFLFLISLGSHEMILMGIQPR